MTTTPTTTLASELTSFNPATGSPVGTVPITDPADIGQIVDQAHAAAAKPGRR